MSDCEGAAGGMSGSPGPLVSIVIPARNEAADIAATLEGGGLNGQTDALRLGIARALCEVNPEVRRVLKKAGMLSRDARAVERKKYGLRKARRAPQYTKR